MNYKKAIAIIAELQTLIALLESPDARWHAVQAWLKQNPRWKDEIDYYIEIEPNEAVENLKIFLLKETEIPGALIAGIATPAIEAQARHAVEILQTLYKNRKAQDKQKEIEA